MQSALDVLTAAALGDFELPESNDAQTVGANTDPVLVSEQLPPEFQGLIQQKPDQEAEAVPAQDLEKESEQELEPDLTPSKPAKGKHGLSLSLSLSNDLTSIQIPPRQFPDHQPSVQPSQNAGPSESRTNGNEKDLEQDALMVLEFARRISGNMEEDSDATIEDSALADRSSGRKTPNRRVSISQKPTPVSPDSGLIICICNISTDDGYTIQCDACNAWQHLTCMNIDPELVPEQYECWRCDWKGGIERGVDAGEAREAQRRRILGEKERERSRFGGVRVGVTSTSNNGVPETNGASSSSVPPTLSESRAGRKRKPPEEDKRKRRRKEEDEEMPPEFDDETDDELRAFDYPVWKYEYTEMEGYIFPYSHGDYHHAPKVLNLANRLLKFLEKAVEITDQSIQMDLPLIAKYSKSTLPQTKVSPLPFNSFLLSSLPPNQTVPYPRPKTYALFSGCTIPKNQLIIPLFGELMKKTDYVQNPINQYEARGTFKGCVRGVGQDIVIDGRRYGSNGRFIRSGCWYNSVVRVFRLAGDQRGCEEEGPIARLRKMGFGIGVFSIMEIGKREEIVLPWEWDATSPIYSLLDIIHSSSPLSLTTVSSTYSALSSSLMSTPCACASKKTCALFWVSVIGRLNVGSCPVGWIGKGEYPESNSAFYWHKIAGIDELSQNGVSDVPQTDMWAVLKGLLREEGVLSIAEDDPERLEKEDAILKQIQLGNLVGCIPNGLSVPSSPNKSPILPLADMPIPADGVPGTVQDVAPEKAPETREHSPMDADTDTDATILLDDPKGQDPDTEDEMPNILPHRFTSPVPQSSDLSELDFSPFKRRAVDENVHALNEESQIDDNETKKKRKMKEPVRLVKRRKSEKSLNDKEKVEEKTNKSEKSEIEEKVPKKRGRKPKNPPIPVPTVVVPPESAPEDVERSLPPSRQTTPLPSINPTTLAPSVANTNGSITPGNTSMDEKKERKKKVVLLKKVAVKGKVDKKPSTSTNSKPPRIRSVSRSPSPAPTPTSGNSEKPTPTGTCYEGTPIVSELQENAESKDLAMNERSRLERDLADELFKEEEDRMDVDSQPEAEVADVTKSVKEPEPKRTAMFNLEPKSVLNSELQREPRTERELQPLPEPQPTVEPEPKLTAERETERETEPEPEPALPPRRISLKDYRRRLVDVPGSTLATPDEEIPEPEASNNHVPAELPPPPDERPDTELVQTPTALELPSEELSKISKQDGSYEKIPKAPEIQVPEPPKQKLSLAAYRQRRREAEASKEEEVQVQPQEAVPGTHLPPPNAMQTSELPEKSDDVLAKLGEYFAFSHSSYSPSSTPHSPFLASPLLSSALAPPPPVVKPFVFGLKDLESKVFSGSRPDLTTKDDTQTVTSLAFVTEPSPAPSQNPADTASALPTTSTKKERVSRWGPRTTVPTVTVPVSIASLVGNAPIAALIPIDKGTGANIDVKTATVGVGKLAVNTVSAPTSPNIRERRETDIRPLSVSVGSRPRDTMIRPAGPTSPYRGGFSLRGRGYDGIPRGPAAMRGWRNRPRGRGRGRGYSP